MKQQTRRVRQGAGADVLAASIAALIATGGFSGLAYGQESAEDTAADAEDTVIVTGTRIRRDDFSATNATTVVTNEDMQTLGVFSVADMIAQLPNNIASVSPETETASAFFLGQSIANLRGLNPYFGTRTLTMVNSRRVPATNTGGSVDLNTIPSALVSRIETVTGGASATYGADALAGVVNIILDDNKDNITTDLSYSTTAEGDGDNIEFSIGAGQQLFDGRGQLSIGFDHTDQEAINDCMTRALCQRGLGYVQNGGFFGGTARPYEDISAGAPYPGQPQYIIQDGMRYGAPREGILWIDPLNTDTFFTFNEAGNDIVPIYDDLAPEFRTLIRGQGPFGDTEFGAGQPTYSGLALRPSTDRQNLFASFSYELEGGIEVDAEISMGQSKSEATQNWSAQSFVTATVQPDNAYLALGSQPMQDEVLSRMQTPFFSFASIAPYLGFQNFNFDGTFTFEFADPLTHYALYKDISGQIGRANISESESDRIAFGANGNLLDFRAWTWDAYVSFGQSESSTLNENYPSSNRQAMAYDAILDDSGAPICRVLYDDPTDPMDSGDMIRDKWLTYFDVVLGDDDDLAERQLYLDTLSSGCAPLNPFGLAASPESIAYAFPDIYEGAEIEQEALSFSVSGDAWRGIGAGPMRMAAGIDYSEQTTENFTFPGRNEILARDFGLNFGDPWAGVTTNKEAFVEFELPLLVDKVAADSLLINIADRRTLNESKRLSGSAANRDNYVSSWKASLVWQPVDLMRVRITRSSDTRAPSARELYATNQPSASAFNRSTLNNPWVMDDPNTPDNESRDAYRSTPAGGNTQLSEERAINQTVGLVFTPVELLEGLQVSVDYYETTIQGGIETVGSNQVVSRCQLEQEAGVPIEQRAYCNQIEFAPLDPSLDPSLVTVPEYGNIEVVNASQENTSPYWSRGIDFSVNYFTQLGGGGSIATRMLATRFLEQSRDLGGYFGRRNVAGQTGANGLGEFFGSFGINYSPTPDISGNLFLTYGKNAFSMTAQARYVGSGRMNLQTGWIAENEVGYYTDIATGDQVTVPFANNIENTTTHSELPSWTTLNLNFNYDFGRSRFNFDRFESLSAYLNITNVGDRIPNFFSGNGAGGLNTTYFSGMGREYRMGVRMEF